MPIQFEERIREVMAQHVGLPITAETLETIHRQTGVAVTEEVNNAVARDMMVPMGLLMPGQEPLSRAEVEALLAEASLRSIRTQLNEPGFMRRILDATTPPSNVPTPQPVRKIPTFANMEDVERRMFL